MKKNIFTITLIFVCFHCFSQYKWEKRTVIETNIFNLVMLGPSIALDVPVSKNVSIATSFQSGKFDWGGFGGLHKFKSFEAEVKRHGSNIYYGGYLKHTTKTVNNEKSYFLIIPISSDRNFKGNALAVGASTGISADVGKRFILDFNMQLGYGKFYKMTDQFPYNLPPDNFLDYRMSFWIGFRL